LLLSKSVLQKNEDCGKTLDLQTSFCSFLGHASPKVAIELAKRSKVIDFYGRRLGADLLMDRS
jgi:hypothetical protein